jgi:hypothetical protein
VQDLEQAGGQKYATIAALAYRQCAGGTKLVWNTKEKKLWYFMKEISSDGDLSTVDVIYPASPFFLHFNPELLRLLLVPLLEYANNETSVLYNFPWAPHHLVRHSTPLAHAHASGSLAFARSSIAKPRVRSAVLRD